MSINSLVIDVLTDNLNKVEAWDGDRNEAVEGWVLNTRSISGSVMYCVFDGEDALWYSNVKDV